MSTNNVLPLNNNQVHFGFGLEAEANRHLQRAASQVASKDATLSALDKAYEVAPERLEVLAARYKYHFYRGELNTAQEMVMETLALASRLGDFSSDWESLSHSSADWNSLRSPARFYLNGLKALAFIRLRQNEREAAENLLNVLHELDGTDQVGANVIRDLLVGLQED